MIGGHASQHHVENAAVAEVLNLHRGVDSGHCGEFDHFTVGSGGSDIDLLSRRQVIAARR